MRLQRKNKTVVQRELFITNLSKNRHFSTAQVLIESSAKVAVSEIIQMLLQEVYHAQQSNEYYYQTVKALWNQLQNTNSSYFQLMEPQSIEILSILDEQPQPSQQKKRKGVVGPDILKKSLLKTVKSRDEFIIAQDSARQSIYDADKRDRDVLIQKIKKEYISILNTKYMSESLPIEESRTYFIQKDNQTVEYLRNSLCNENKLKKLNKVALKKNQNQQNGKQKQLTTFYKKSKEYIDKIDPTNSYFKTEICESQSVVSPKRGSIYRFDPNGLIGLDETVTIRQSNFKEITNTVAPSKEILNQLELKLEKATRFPTLVSGERDQLSQRIDHHSIQQKSKTKKLTKQSEKDEIRLKNSVSVCVLPRIKH